MLKLLICLSILFAICRCECRGSRKKFCDSIVDLQNYNTKQWREVYIGIKSLLHEPAYNLTEDFFNRLPLLKSLTIINQINNININSRFLYGTDMEHFVFDQNNLNTVPDLMFSGFDQLQSVRMENSSIENLGEYLVHYNAKMKLVSFAHNKIRTVRRSRFCNDCRIDEIVLSFNMLSVIEAEAFPKSIKILNLSHNKLEYLHKDVFKNLANLEMLNLYHNKLASVPDVQASPSLRYLGLSLNAITMIDSNAVANLTNLLELDLSHNKLRHIDLVGISLQNKVAEFTLFLDFNRLVKLDLGGNSSSIPRRLSLYGNPWNCGCLMEMERELQKRNVGRVRCDFEMFQNHKVPICINPILDVRNPLKCYYQEVDEVAYQKFIQIIKNNPHQYTCEEYGVWDDQAYYVPLN